MQFFCDDKEIVREILFCIKILPENLSEIFWLEKWIYELKKEVIYQRFSKESLYLSTEKQKEQWQLIKKLLDKKSARVLQLAISSFCIEKSLSINRCKGSLEKS